MKTKEMNEKLFQYIWQFQYFNKQNLQTTDGKNLEILSVGQINKGQGPDFLNAKIKIENIILAGHIELHLKEQNWFNHSHHKDKNYDTVILHVILQNTENIKLPTQLPTLILGNKISTQLLEKYNYLMQQQHFIACENYLPNLSKINKIAWIERLGIERLNELTDRIKIKLAETKNNWEESFWQLLARNYGVSNNSLCFETMAKTIPINVIAKYKNNPIQIEALLLGQANLLNETILNDKYYLLLQKEYQYLAKLHQLQKQTIPALMGRARPANFPTIRLAQLASLVVSKKHLFRKILEADTITDLEILWDASPNDYWLYHYSFNHESEKQEKKLGSNMFQIIMINTVVPFVYAYGVFNNNNELKLKAEKWWQELKPEKNNIINGFTKLNIKPIDAFESQALLYLKKNYCDTKRCLECSWGNSFLKEKKL